MCRATRRGWRPIRMAAFPIAATSASPAPTVSRLEQFSLGYAFEHRFNNNLQFRSNFRYFDVSQDLAGVRSEGLLPDFRTVLRSFNYVKSAAQNVALDNHVQADFATGPLTHKVLVGFDYNRQASTSDYKFSMIAPIDVFAPVYGAPVPAASTLPSFINTATTMNQAGLYLQDQVKLDRWTLTMTGRQDWAQAETVSKGFFPAPGTYLQNDRASTGRVGLNYLFDIGLSPYANYSTSFVPISGTDQFGSPFKPTTGEGAEIGVKFKPVGSNLMLTAAVFEVTQQNVLTRDPGNINFSVQTGEARVRGVEFEVRGNVTRELELVGGYNIYDPRVTKSNDGFVGKYHRQYRAPAGVAVGEIYLVRRSARRASASAVVPAMSAKAMAMPPTRSLSRSTRCTTPPSATTSVSAARVKGWSAQVNATNLTNKYYVSSCLTAMPYCGLGAARTVLGTLKYAWN